MELRELLDICIQKKRIICLVGGGGKTTLMYRIAEEAARFGKKTVVSTTTHIYESEHYRAADMETVRALWSKHHYAAIGRTDRKDPAKWISPDPELYAQVRVEADLILLEADGAKGYPCKVPAEHEPVLPGECDLVIGVMGMTAWGQKLSDCCFRYETHGSWLGHGEKRLDEDLAERLLTSPQGTAKITPLKEYIVVLNRCDNEDLYENARKLASRLEEEHGIRAVCCCLKNTE